MYLRIAPARYRMAQTLAASVAARLGCSASTYELGYIGEQALCKLFIQRDGTYAPTVLGPDAGDLKLRMLGGFDVTIDIKVAGHPMSSMLVVPLSQLRRRTFDIYIAARATRSEGQIEILGYAHADELVPGPLVSRLPFLEDCCVVEYERLHPVSDIIFKARPGQLTERYPLQVRRAFQAGQQAAMGIR